MQVKECLWAVAQDYPACGRFRDFFFRKHCSVARFLEMKTSDYILLLGKRICWGSLVLSLSSWMAWQGLFSTVITLWYGLIEAGKESFLSLPPQRLTIFAGLDHWLQEVAATDVVLYERWMNNEIMASSLLSQWCVVVHQTCCYGPGRQATTL